jgi:hypothetical protein
MSRFESLWNAYANDAKAHQRTRSDAFDFIPNFISKLLQAFDWSTEQAYLQKREKEKFVSYIDAQKSLEKFITPGALGVWQFNLQLVLWKDTIPSQGIDPLKLVIPFTVSKEKDFFRVAIKTTRQGQEEFSIRHTAGADEFEELCEFLLNAMLQRIQQSIHWEIEVQSSNEPVLL